MYRCTRSRFKNKKNEPKSFLFSFERRISQWNVLWKLNNRYYNEKDKCLSDSWSKILQKRVKTVNNKQLNIAQVMTYLWQTKQTILKTQYTKLTFINFEKRIKVIKLLRAYGECLGIKSRRRTQLTAIYFGERYVRKDPEVSEWGNPITVMCNYT